MVSGEVLEAHVVGGPWSQQDRCQPTMNTLARYRYDPRFEVIAIEWSIAAGFLFVGLAEFISKPLAMAEILGSAGSEGPTLLRFENRRSSANSPLLAPWRLVRMRGENFAVASRIAGQPKGLIAEA